MFRAAAKAIKRRSPTLHEFMKRVSRGSKLPTIKLLEGKFTLTSLNLISASPTEPHVLRWIDELLSPEDTFFDVGAHYGWMSLVACHCVGTKGKVVAFEPSPPLVELLQYNKKINRFHQMEIVTKAVADCDNRVVPFYLVECGDTFLNSMVEHAVEVTAGLTGQKSMMEVETVTLDEFCKMRNLHPNVVKIDVEGGELLALNGSRALLKECSTAFIVAVHPTWLPQGQKAAELFDLFRVHGYKVVASQCVQYDGADFGDYLFVPDRSTTRKILRTGK
jgi:FkbM family methyltransferase